MYQPRRKGKKKPATLIVMVSRNFLILSHRDFYIAWLSLLSLSVRSVILTSESNQAISYERMALKYAILIFLPILSAIIEIATSIPAVYIYIIN